jgi:IclR family KDG regulon transcriptional repressor
MVEKNEKTQKYHLGLAAFELGFSVYRNMQLRNVSKPLLDRLMKSLRKVVHMGVYDKGEVLYICKSKLPADADPNTLTQVGRRVPSFCTAEGKVLLSHQGESEMARFLGNELKAYTPKSITAPGKLRECLDEVKKRGYAVSHEELQIGVSSISVPVSNDRGQVVSAISIAGATGYFQPQMITEYVRELKTYSRIIGERLDVD